MSDKNLGLAVAYAAKRRTGVKTQVAHVDQELDAPASLYEAIAGKHAPISMPEDELDFSSDIEEVELLPEPELESTGNALADKIRAKLIKR